MTNLGIDSSKMTYTGDSAYYVSEHEMTKEETSSILDEIIQEANEDDIPEDTSEEVETEEETIQESVDDMLKRLETQRKSGVIDDETYKVQKEKLEARRENEEYNSTHKDPTKIREEQEEREEHPYKYAAKSAKEAITNKISTLRHGNVATEGVEDR